MEFRLLGPLEVVGDDGAPMPLGGRRPRALLALLLLNANEVVSVDRLIDGIWGDAAAGERRGCAPGARARAAQGARGRPDRHAGARLPAARRGRGARSASASSGSSRERRSLARGARALARARPRRRRRTSRSPRRRRRALEESRLAALEARLEADLAPGAKRDLVGRAGRARRRAPASRAAAGASSCSRCTGRAGRLTRSRLTGTRGASCRRARPRAVAELRALEQPDPRQDPALAAGAAGASRRRRRSADRPVLVGRDLELTASRRCSAGPTCAWSRSPVRAASARPRSRWRWRASRGAAFVDLASVEDPAARRARHRPGARARRGSGARPIDVVVDALADDPRTLRARQPRASRRRAGARRRAARTRRRGCGSWPRAASRSGSPASTSTGVAPLGDPGPPVTRPSTQLAGIASIGSTSTAPAGCCRRSR